MKKLTLLFIGVFSFLTMFAGKVTEAEALQKAQQFMQGKEFKQCHLRRAVSTNLPNNAFYVFNAVGDGGFVIVSADDRTREILAYSEHGNLDLEHMPDNMKWWLDSYARQIAALGTSQNPTANNSSNRGQRAAIVPLVSAQWSQEAPYNSMCPDGNYVDYDENGYDANNRCLTGCVATAMAQLMYYWKWPETCPALDSYETSPALDSHETSRHTIKALPATTFKWDKMKDYYSYDETGDAVDAVAELMRYCGQAVKMDYGIFSSGAKLYPSILMTTFQYGMGMHQVSRTGYTADQWDTILYDELAAQRPVLYSGFSYSSDHQSGHQFIVDGYDGNGMFHINWGWGGYPDSYYVLSVADTEESIDYQDHQEALINVKPSEGATVELLVDGLKYLCSPDDKTAMIIRNDDPDESATSVTIPSSINVNGVDCKVTTIGDFTFNYWNRMKEIIIPEGVEAIESYAFKDCFSLRKIVLPSTLTYIGDRAFYGDDLVVIQSNIQNPPQISVDAFLCEENSLLTDRFSGKYNMLAELYVPVGTIAKYEAIPGWARLLKIQEGTIQEAMVGNLKYWYPSDGSTAIVVNDDSYKDESMTEVTIPSTINVDGKTYQVTSIGNIAFAVCGNLLSVSLPEGLEIIGSGAFTSCPQLLEITFPSTLKVIGDGAFANWHNIQALSIPEGVEMIGARAFVNMSSLTQVELPNSLKYIGDRCFRECNLSAVVSHIIEPFTVSPLAFTPNDDEPSHATLYVPMGTKPKYEAIEGWTRFANIEEGEHKEGFVGNLKYSYSTEGTTAIVIQDNSYKTLTEVIIPASVNIDGRTYQVTGIGDAAFNGCSQLLKVSLPEGVEVIGNNSFSQTSLSEITLPHSLKQIGEYAFMDCSSIKTMIVPEGVETIGREAFKRMNNLEILELPASLSFMGIRLIQKDANLVSVVSHLTEPFFIYDDVFELKSDWDYETSSLISTPSPATLYVPAGTKAKYEAIHGWTIFAKIEELPNIDPITNSAEVSFSDVINEGTDLSNTVIGNAYYNLDAENGDGYDAEEQAIVLNSTTTDEQMTAVQDVAVGGGALLENYKGIIFEVPAGSGVVTVDTKTIGTHVLNVQIGNGTPTTITMTERGTIDVPFDVTEPTYVYLYASTTEGNAARLDRASSAAANSVLLYGYKVMIEHPSYTLTYYVDGFIYKSFTIKEGETITPEPNPEKEGYTFSGWKGLPETMPAHDVTVNGTFSVNSYTLTYMIDEVVYKQVAYEYGATIKPEPQPEGDYVSFEWVGVPETMPAHDVTVTAVYETGIAEIMMMAQQGQVRIYSPNGKLLSKLQKGLNIVVMQDGTTKKVVVK